MITTLDIIDIVWNKINSSALKNAVSGGIYKIQRPAGSKVEDVVVNSLPINNLDMQSAIINVNIHVPNIKIAVNGVNDTFQPDFVRIKTLASVAVPVLTNMWAGDYNFNIQQQQVFSDETAMEHYINFRIDFFNINTLN